MIDWFKGKIEIEHLPLTTGAFIVIDEDGEIEREVIRSRSLEGSHSSKIIIRSVGSNGDGKATHLEVSGNPAKFLQGHNVFGSDDLRALVEAMAKRIFAKLDMEPTEQESEKLRAGDVYCNWVDINYPYEMNCQTDVQAWIKAAEFRSRTRSGRSAIQGSTLYWQKNSRRWAIKAYSKWLELQVRKHRLPAALQETKLLGWTEKILRLELRLLGKELRDLEIDKVSDLPPERVSKLFGDYMNRIVLTGQLKIADEVFHKLKGSLRASYMLWRDGHLMNQVLSKSTFYKHRKQLLDFGIDISIAREKEESNVIPMIRVLEAKPAQIPEWAFEEGLIFQPEKVA